MKPRPFEVLRSPSTKSWAVYLVVNPLYCRFHAGPFSEQAVAESECKRLNDLEKANA